MPTVHVEISLRTIELIGISNLGKSAVRRGKLGIFAIHIKIICSAKIILCARSANAGEFGIAVNIEFDLAFSPPAIGFDTPMQIGSNIKTVSFNVVEYRIYFFIGQWIDAPELGMKIQTVRRYLFFFTINLIVNIRVCSSGVFNFYAKSLTVEELEGAFRRADYIRFAGKNELLSEEERKNLIQIARSLIMSFEKPNTGAKDA